MRVHKTAPNQSSRPFDIHAMLAERETDRYALHTQHLNEMMVLVLQTLGFDIGFRTGQGHIPQTGKQAEAPDIQWRQSIVVGPCGVQKRFLRQLSRHRFRERRSPG